MRLLPALIVTLLAVPVLIQGVQRKSDSSSRPIYGIAQIEIHDRETYREYERGFGPIFQRHGGEMLAVSERPHVLEGEWPWTRTVILRFPSRQALEGWYNSDEYQQIARHRWASSKANLVLLEGRPVPASSPAIQRRSPEARSAPRR